MGFPRATLHKIGKLELSIYEFEHAGDEIPEHVHDATNNHITIIARGDFKVTGEASIAGEILCMGEVIDWPAGQRHGFIAMNHGARLVQILK